MTNPIHANLQTVLVEYIGHGAGATVQDLADRAGVSKETIYSLRRGAGTTSLEAFWRIFEALPKEAQARFSHLCGYRPFKRVKGAPQCLRKLAATLAHTVAVITSALAKDRTDHRDLRHINEQVLPQAAAVIDARAGYE